MEKTVTEHCGRQPETVGGQQRPIRVITEHGSGSEFAHQLPPAAKCLGLPGWIRKAKVEHKFGVRPGESAANRRVSNRQWPDNNVGIVENPFCQPDILNAEQYPVTKAPQCIDDRKQVKKVTATGAPFPDAQRPWPGHR
jgi:hypothetical protein